MGFGDHFIILPFMKLKLLEKDKMDFLKYQNPKMKALNLFSKG